VNLNLKELCEFQDLKLLELRYQRRGPWCDFLVVPKVEVVQLVKPQMEVSGVANSVGAAWGTVGSVVPRSGGILKVDILIVSANVAGRELQVYIITYSGSILAASGPAYTSRV
jgi:hypothetical protein